MKNFVTFIILIFTVCLKHIDNAKILAILPMPNRSHFVMYRKVLEELATRGHEVDVFTPFDNNKNISGLKFIKETDIFKWDSLDHAPLKKFREMSVHGLLNLMLSGKNETHSECRAVFELEETKALRDTKKKYDLLFLENFVSDCFFGFAHVMNVPVVAITSSVDLPWGTSRIGNPDNPSYIPTYFRDLLPEMTLYERLLNTITLVHTKLMHKYHQIGQEKDAREFFGYDLPHLNELVSNVSLFILNSHFSLNQARPNNPNVIEVGGLHIDEPGPVDEKIEKIIGSSKFILMSLGTVACSETMELQQLQNLCDAFREMGVKVIWKADRAKLGKKLIIPDNVYVEKWLPQINILCHPNILFFITHSGLMGTQEAVYCGVPMLSTPIFADQYLNSKNMVQKGLAIQLDLETTTKDEILSSMKELVNNPKYTINAERLSTQFKDRPRKPLDEAIYWIEYVLKYKGAPQLRSKAADLTWYQYYLVDIALIILLYLIIVSITMYIAYKKLVCILCKKNVKHKLN